MEALDKIKDALKSGKEQAIMNSVMSMFGGELNKIKPENEVAQFIEDYMPALFIPDEAHQGEYEAMAGIVAKLLIAEANDNPQHAIKKMLEFYEHFRQFYKHLREKNGCEDKA